MAASDRPRPSAASRAARTGDFGSVVANALMLFLLNVTPGWQVLPFLTADTARVLGAVNASLVATIVAGLVYVVVGSRTVRALGGVVTAGFALVALLRIWRVFPFDFAGSAYDWTLVTRVVLGFAVAATVVGILASVALLSRGPGSRA